MKEVFAYYVVWEVPDDKVGHGVTEKKSAQFLLALRDPVEALPIILNEIKWRWGKTIRVHQFQGPQSGPQYFIPVETADVPPTDFVHQGKRQ